MPEPPPLSRWRRAALWGRVFWLLIAKAASVVPLLLHAAVHLARRKQIRRELREEIEAAGVLSGSPQDPPA